MPRQTALSNIPRPALFAGLYALIWGGATAYLAAKGADWSFPLISLGVFGLILSGLTWVLTRNAHAPAVRVQRPGVELAALLAFLAIYAVAFLGFGMTAVRGVFPHGRAQELLVLGVKLAVHVALPALLLTALGARLSPLFAARVRQPGFWPVLIVLGLILLGLLSVVSPSLKQIAATHAPLATLAWAAPACFAWIALEAGLCEEFLFRAVLQTRLSAALKSEVGAVVIGALLFGLAHAPGLYLRGNADVDGWSTDPLQVIAYTIAALSPLALLFGTIWARTRSLLLVVLLHAAVDVLPGLPDFLKIWAL
jgi:membrane protease YdiL (CAAX protease family)